VHVEVFRLWRQDHHALHLIGYVYDPKHLSVLFLVALVDFEAGKVNLDWRDLEVAIPLQLGIDF
jgi:hypothetical protein